mmetsp:Transcript_9260/g.39266  ORF Transcript_9260/g.39266 Transcript_9260/m.39266 type:complete len:220 (+) Transcript_9260:257-916(+)
MELIRSFSARRYASAMISSRCSCVMTPLVNAHSSASFILTMDIPRASAVLRSMSALFRSLMSIVHAGCSHGSPSTCMGKPFSTITFTFLAWQMRTGLSTPQLSCPRCRAPYTTTTSTIPSCIELAPYPSLLSHMRTPPANELMFKRIKPSVSGGSSHRTPSAMTCTCLCKPAHECSTTSRAPKRPYKILFVNALKKRCGEMLRVRWKRNAACASTPMPR